jgi:hypothetical protein
MSVNRKIMRIVIFNYHITFPNFILLREKRSTQWLPIKPLEPTTNNFILLMVLLL